MSETLDYIESYFKQTLSPGQKQRFEEQCVNDNAFAKEVAFYLAHRDVLHEELLQKKQQAWNDKTEAQKDAHVIAFTKKKAATKWWTYAAAACLILFVCSYFLVTVLSASPEKLASNYVAKNFTQLSLTMDGSKDSMQLGLDAYNNKNYDAALAMFTAIQRRQPDNSDAVKNVGVVYLVTLQYDKALEQFTTLSNIPGLYSNAGDFLKAVTLLQRNQPGDKEAAKQLLQIVVKNKEEESEEAKKWLEKW